MDELQRRAVLKQTFDAVSGGYDGAALRFFPSSARNMAELAGLRGDEHVVDMACGTGHATFALARLLPRGRVTAIDFSPGMLEQARKKAAALGVRNVEFLERDMQDLGFAGEPFDLAVCAFGIFFADDMAAQLVRIASPVERGGRVMISTFEEGYFQPLRDLMTDRLVRYGAQPPPETWKRIASDAGCRALFGEAGLRNVRVERRNVGYHLESAEQWWDVIWNAGMRRLVSQLAPNDQARFKSEHLREVEALRSARGILLDVGVLYATGTKP